MLNFMSQYGLFLAKTLTLVAAILGITGGVINLMGRGREKRGSRLSIKKLNERYADIERQLQLEFLSKKEYKRFEKQKKQAHKKEKAKKTSRVFVIYFEGDIRASEVEALREEITALLMIVTPQDEVVLCLESGGGMVHAYGLAASQLQRIVDRHIPLTVIVDKIAASGGYMMACIANKIIAAPFAIIGSIGVVAAFPNFNRFLKKHAIDYEQLTAGEHKRTLTMFGENTEASRKKVQAEIEETHELFKTFIKQNRAQVDIEKVATGEHWFAVQAKNFHLVDDLQTSDDYLLKASQTAEVYEVKYIIRKPWSQRLGINLQKAFKFFIR